MRPLPTIAGIAIAIGLAAMASGCGSSTGTGSGASSADTAFYGGTILVISAQAGDPTLPLTKVDEIKQVAGVKAAFAAYRFDAKTGSVDTGGVAAADSIVASDPTEAAWSSLRTSYAQGHAIDADSSGEVVLGSALAQELKKTTGDTVELPLNPSGGAVSHSFKVVGILDVTHTGPDRFATINITDGQMLLKDALPAAQRDQIDVTTVATAIDVYAKTGTSIADLDKIADQINQQVAGVRAFKPSEVVASAKR